MGVEDVDDLGKICERPRQSIDLVDNDDLNLAGLDVLQKPLECRPLRRARPAAHAPKSRKYQSGCADGSGSTRLRRSEIGDGPLLIVERDRFGVVYSEQDLHGGINAHVMGRPSR